MNEKLGAAQIKVKLINAVDEALIARELLSPKALRCCEVEAILDSSLIHLVLPAKVAQQLGLRMAVPAGASPSEALTTEALRLAWEGHLITEDALIAGDQVRLGRVVLEKLGLMAGVMTGVQQPFHLEDLAEADLWM